MERFAKQTGMTAADDCLEKRFHLAKGLRQLGRNSSVIVKEPPIGFLPGVDSLTPKLFAKVFTNERVRIEMPGVVGIFPSEESGSS
jgi:hypothetical protein